MLQEFALLASGQFHAKGNTSDAAPLFGLWDANGVPIWTGSEVQNYPPYAYPVVDVLVPIGDDAAAVRWQNSMRVYWPSRDPVSTADVLILALGRARNGFLVYSGQQVRFYDSLATLSEERSGPVFAGTPTVLLESSSGDVLAAAEISEVNCGSAMLERRRRVGDAELEVAWNAEQEGRNWFALAETPAGNLVVGGRARSADVGCRPLVSQFSADGALLWEWLPPVETVTGEVLELVVDPGGAIYAASTEDSVSAAASDPRSEACRDFGCNRLVVRKFTDSGEVLWEYERREALSEAQDMALDSSGHPVVLGAETREGTYVWPDPRTSTILLTFAE